MVFRIKRDVWNITSLFILLNFTDITKKNNKKYRYKWNIVLNSDLQDIIDSQNNTITVSDFLTLNSADSRCSCTITQVAENVYIADIYIINNALGNGIALWTINSDKYSLKHAFGSGYSSGYSNTNNIYPVTSKNGIGFCSTNDGASGNGRWWITDIIIAEKIN